MTGPTGHRLKHCETCKRLIPWSRSQQTPTGWATRQQYYRRRFCSLQCAGKHRRGRKGFTPTFEHDYVPFVAVRTFAEIHACDRCHSVSLYETRVARVCRMCGTAMYAADGRWTSEAVVMRR